MLLSEVTDVFHALKATREFDNNSRGLSMLEHLLFNIIGQNISHPERIALPKQISNAITALVKRSATAHAAKGKKPSAASITKRTEATNEVMKVLTDYVLQLLDGPIRKSRLYGGRGPDATVTWYVGTPTEIVAMWDEVLLPLLTNILEVAQSETVEEDDARDIGQRTSALISETWESGFATKKSLTKLRADLQLILKDVKKLAKPKAARKRAAAGSRAGGSGSSASSCATCVNGFVQLPCKVGYRQKHYVNIAGKKVYIE
jgi:hypothetical protein